MWERATPSSAPNRYLRIYLQDHYAGATGGVRLAERSAREHASSELGGFLGDLAGEIREDRDELAVVMRRLGVPPSSAKNAVVALTELAGRLKPNGHLGGASPLTPLVELEALTGGVSGKRSLWQILSRITDTRLAEFDFETLIDRAERQLAGLERHRLAASARAFRGASPATNGRRVPS